MDKPIYDSFQVFIPVRENQWESYHSSLNHGQSSLTLAREFSVDYDLRLDAQSWNMYEPSGNIAAITTDWSESGRNRQKLLYVRLDLLRSYLLQRDMDLVWVIWGERTVALSRLSNHHAQPLGFKHYEVFKELLLFDRSNSSVMSIFQMDLEPE